MYKTVALSAVVFALASCSTEPTIVKDTSRATPAIGFSPAITYTPRYFNHTSNVIRTNKTPEQLRAEGYFQLGTVSVAAPKESPVLLLVEEEARTFGADVY